MPRLLPSIATLLLFTWWSASHAAPMVSISAAPYLAFQGDTHSLTMRVRSDAPEAIPVALYLALEVGGEFLFYPSYTGYPEPFAKFTLPGNYDSGVFSLITLPLPEAIPHRARFTWYAAMLHTDTWQLVGEIASSPAELLPGRAWRVAHEPPYDFNTITAAVADSNISAGDTILVADGNYTVQNGEVWPLRLRGGMKLRGESFSHPPKLVGHPIDMNQQGRGSPTCQTVLLADNTGNEEILLADLDIKGGMGHWVWAERPRRSSEEFPIFNEYRRRGGGLYAEGAAIRLERCAFHDGSALDGGGLAVVRSKVWIDSCRVFSNVTDYGTNDEIYNPMTSKFNVLDSAGGGMYLYRCEIFVSACVFEDNGSRVQIWNGGRKSGPAGGLLADDSNLTLVEVAFLRNKSSVGALCVSYNSLLSRRCIFGENTGFVTVSAVYAFYCTVVDEGSRVRGNMSRTFRRDDAANPVKFQRCQVSLVGTIFENNEITAGVAIFDYCPLATMKGCKVKGSRSIPGDWRGKRLLAFGPNTVGVVEDCVLLNDRAVSEDISSVMTGGDSFTTIKNSILQGRISAIQARTEVVSSTIFGNVQVEDPSNNENKGEITIKNCIVQGAMTTYYGTVRANHCLFTEPIEDLGTGNIVADPRFVDPSNGDYRLLPGSPAIDAGEMTSETPVVDLDGRPRPNPNTGIPDLGVYEYYAE